MTDEIKIWAVKKDASSATPVPSADQTDKEKWLEDALVANPEMLMSGLRLVGRQTPTVGGPLDLLGVDQDGRLVVFELKKGTLARDAVTQVIDYCSHLEFLGEDELANLIAEQSDNLGDKIDNFAEWYGELSGGEPLDALRPVRMVLVGLGVDDKASRMVEFLAKKGVEISLLTFHGYQYNGETLLARQEPRTEPGSPRLTSLRPSRAERRHALEERARSLGISDLWNDAVKTFSEVGTYRSTSPLISGLTFYMSMLRLPDHTSNFLGSHSVRFDSDGKLGIIFFPAAVHLCLEKFQQQQDLFKCETSPHAPTTNKVANEWYCLLDSEGWETHKPALKALASDVYEAWEEARRDANNA